MTVPAIRTDLTPAKEGEISEALGALFEQFPSQNTNDPWAKFAGYVEALQGEPAWAIAAAVRRFLHGKVSSHEGKWLPTSAELARVVREESDYARRRLERQERPVMIEDKRESKIDERRYQQLKDLAKMLGGGTETRDDKLAALEIMQAAPVRKELVEALERQRRPE